MLKQGTILFKNKPAGTITKETDGSFTFEYQANASRVSLTLPNQDVPYKSDDLFPFFDGLIPEGWLLNLVQKNWKIPKNDRMTLLLTTCQDCIGATTVLVSLPHDPVPRLLKILFLLTKKRAFTRLVSMPPMYRLEDFQIGMTHFKRIAKFYTKSVKVNHNFINLKDAVIGHTSLGFFLRLQQILLSR